MSSIILHRKQLLKWSIPYWLFVNNQPVGIISHKETTLNLPAGSYFLKIAMVFQLLKWRFSISGEKHVTIGEDELKHFAITDKERWWNFLFDIDLLFWIARFFFTLSSPWSIVYEIVSDGFFVVWLLRVYLIRRHYFQLKEIS